MTRAATSIPREIWLLFKEALAGWREDRAASMGAALAYYTAFSLAVNAAIAAAGKAMLAESEILLHGITLVISYGVATVLFAAIYKVLPNVRIGAEFTAARARRHDSNLRKEQRIGQRPPAEDRGRDAVPSASPGRRAKSAR